jgi:linoleoyl-CoA desaturase
MLTNKYPFQKPSSTNNTREMTPVKIKFPNQKQPEFINELRLEVKKYFDEKGISKYGNTSLVTKTILMLLLYFAPFALMLSGLVVSAPAILLCWAIMGIAMAGLGMGVMHDANHGSYSQKASINKFVSQSMYLLGGFPTNWKYQHNTMHHGFTNVDGHDEDIDPPAGILRLSPHKPLNKIHKFQHWYAWGVYGIMTLSWITMKDFKQLFRYKKEKAPLASNKSYNRLIFDLIISKIIFWAFFFVLPIILVPVPWYITVVGFIVMHFIAGFILGIVFQSAHVVPSSVYPRPDEEGNMENSWAIHQLYTTADFSPKSWLLSWYTGGLNFQIEHHLFPNISHVHYKDISKLVKGLAEKYKLPYYVQPTFAYALRNHTMMLKKLGR